MTTLPDFWRTEVFHPLTVHFPVALLLTAVLFKLIAVFARSKMWGRAGTVLLLLGTLGAWVAVYTGNLADGAVSRGLCDPTVVKAHANNAERAAWLFSVALLPDLLLLWKGEVLPRMAGTLRWVVLVLVLTGAGFLSYAGHLGASLVYQQAAGVYRPSEDCGEFE